jgi:coenzyme F420-reducing hydrogenase alpha subunit
MALPLKSLPLEIRQHTHKVLDRIASNRGITLRELGREIIEAYVAKAVHDAKVVLGQDDDNEAEADSGVVSRNRPESHGGGRK